MEEPAKGVTLDLMLESHAPKMHAEDSRSAADDLDRRVASATDLTLAEYRLLLKRLKAAEQALKESRAENDVYFELAGVGRADVLAETGAFVRVNRAFSEIVGYSRDELLEFTLRDISHPDDREIFFSDYPRVVSGEIDHYATEKRYIHKDGRIVWVSIHASLLPRRAGSPQIMTGYIQDITSRKAAEAAANASAARFRGIFENSLDAIAVYKARTHVIVNPAYVRLFGYGTAEEILPIPGIHLIAVAEREVVNDRIERRLRGESALSDYLTRGVRKDGTEFDLEIHASNFQVDGETFRLGILRDVSEQIRSRETIRLAHDELEKRVAERTRDLSYANARLHRESSKRKRLELAMWDAIDREQRRIGEDLHDSLGQQLAGISCSLKAIRAPEIPGLSTDLARVARLLAEAVVQTRDIAHGLHPPELEEGLFFALRYLSQRITESYGVDCRFIAGDPFHIRESNSRQLYRIAQEAITNSLKHGQANRIILEMTRSHGVIRLKISDNGVGFGLAAGARPGMGLKTMRNRARLLGGTIKIRRNEDGGASVVCSFHPET